MRLIDLDAFRDENGFAEHCSECKRGYRCDRELYSARDFCGWLDDVPTVDAIPIDWLTERINETANSPNDKDVELNHALFWTSVEWERWKKENGTAADS